MTTKKNDAAALTDEQSEGVSGGLLPWPSLRPVQRVQSLIILTAFPSTVRPRPPMGPCGSRGRAGIINPDSM